MTSSTKKKKNDKRAKRAIKRNNRELAKLSQAEKKLKKSNPPAGSPAAKHKAKLLKAIQAKKKNLQRLNKLAKLYLKSKSKKERAKLAKRYNKVRDKGRKGDKLKKDKYGNIIVSCPRGTLVVIVKDADGKPVHNALVNAGPWGSRYTDKKGIANFGQVNEGTSKITAKKAGHAKKRNGQIGRDSKASVAVTGGAKTTVNLIQHPSCANVSFFEGCPTRSNYFGFDHKTNLVANPGTGEYWLPTPAKGSLTMPSNKKTRDGARWVSVAVGKQTEVEINFAFKGIECIPCIANSKFEVIPGSIADVVTKKVNTKSAYFKIKGKAAGEASLKVTCDGKDIGWFHIWSKQEKTIKVDVVNLITNRAPSNSFSLASLRSAFHEIFTQAVLKIDIKSLGSVDLKSNATLATTESTGYPASGKFLLKSGSPSPYSKKSTVLTALDVAASAVLAARTTGPLPRAGAYRIYRYVPSVGCSIGGTVLNIGASPAFSFMSDSASARNSIAHEFGHCLGLRHPSDGSSASQFASHNRSTLNQAVAAYAKTNTEPATSASGAASNVMANDPTNLMGYWSDKANRKPLRYHQWDACKRS